MKKPPFQLKSGLMILFFLFFYTLQAQFTCPFLRVNVASDGWVACDNAVAQIRICNEGAPSANNSSLVVNIPAEFAYVGSQPAPSIIAGKTLTYFMGSIAGGDCRTIALTLAVPCDAQPGEAFCLKASASPKGCPSSFPGWDGSILKVKGNCSAPDSVWFKINNIGIGPTGASQGYVIIEDHLMRSAQSLPIINNGDSTTIALHNPDGSTYTFQTTQTPGNPFPEPISVSVEGCGANPGNTGYLLQYPQFDGDIHSDIFCDIVTADIQGFQKKGFPLGYGTEHLIDRRTTLNYRLRFQNPGPGTVQLVTLTDTLSGMLNLSSFRAGAASHPYTFSIQNQVLTVVFSGLNLPPASVNESASRGFFSFNIGVADNAPEDALITNTAFITLNSQSPVSTETTSHRLGENFITVDVIEQKAFPEFTLQLMPNPAKDIARFEFGGIPEGSKVQVRITDVSGQALRTLETSGDSLYFERGNMASGVYFFTAQSESGQRIGGRIVLR